MSKRKKDQMPGRRVRVRSVRRGQPDAGRLASVIIALAMAEVEKEAEAQAEAIKQAKDQTPDESSK